jgi:hypothetical protein
MHWLAPVGFFLFAALPSTANYKLNSFGFGSGGTANSTTSTYALEGTSGEISGQTASTANYNLKPGFIHSQQANVPKIAAFDNGGGTFYNKLHFVIDEQNNPSDALYALSISTDNFNTDTRYVKSDLTVGVSLALADYQSYAAWGGASGANIISLSLLPNTTYYLRAKATQGKHTESGYGPALSVATVGPQLSFSLSTNSINIGTLLPGSVISAAQTIDAAFATNAASGGEVYINGQNTGLLSTRSGFSIGSASGDLSALTRGFGVQVSAISASSGIFSSLSPYNVAGNNVGITDTTIRRIMTASGPIVGGSSSVLLKAKAAANDPAAADYKETLTMLASANF